MLEKKEGKKEGRKEEVVEQWPKLESQTTIQYKVGGERAPKGGHSSYTTKKKDIAKKTS